VGTRTRANTRHRIRQFRRCQRFDARLGRTTLLGADRGGAPLAASAGTRLRLSFPTILGDPSASH